MKRNIQAITIFVDMDEVVASFIDFYTQYADEKGVCVRHKDADRNPDLFQNAVLQDEIFTQLEPTIWATELVSHLLELQEHYHLNIEFLSSVNSKKPEVAAAAIAQKLAWIQKHNLIWPANFVQHHTLKADYAHNLAILIDDNPACVDPFNAKGGHGILFTEFNQDFIEQLRDKLELASGSCAA